MCKKNEGLIILDGIRELSCLRGHSSLGDTKLSVFDEFIV